MRADGPQTGWHLFRFRGDEVAAMNRSAYDKYDSTKGQA